MKAACTPNDYGTDLYDSEMFVELFPEFKKKQINAAETIWNRILSRCGQDADLPPIDTIVSYGCGEGTLLNKLCDLSSKSKPTCRVIGMDISPGAVKKAKTKCKSHGNVLIFECAHCPEEALNDLTNIKQVDWSKTALCILSHTWFHLDQIKLISTITTLRPELLLVDVFTTWDNALANLPCNEHGRKFSDDVTYWLRTEKLTDKHQSGKVRRGIWREYKKPPSKNVDPWLFSTIQQNISTKKLFGNHQGNGTNAGPEKILRLALKKGKLLDEDGEACFIRRRVVKHESGWGDMDCHVLVARDPLADILNRSYFQVVENLIQHEKLPIKSGSEKPSPISSLITLFDEELKSQKKITGSREAIVLLPFDPNLTFARVVPLFSFPQNNNIAKYSLLLEKPSRDQLDYPSAYGAFETVLGRSSSMQSLPLIWASDYEATEVDKAFFELEMPTLGLKLNGVWPGEKTPPSYFMLPIYFGSLPLLALALKFPSKFNPRTTGFEVFFSTLSNLHNIITVSLTDYVIRMHIVRPWIEGVLSNPKQWPKKCDNISLTEKLDILETYIFGKRLTRNISNNRQCYHCGHDQRIGGVLGMEWKSWVLGLPTYPINKLASVEAMNTRLWNIWQQEKELAARDVDLRISRWFEEGRFFSDKAHDNWVCSIHFRCLREMFTIIIDRDEGDSERFDWDTITRFSKNDLGDEWYFCGVNDHWLMAWLRKQLGILQPPTNTNRCKKENNDQCGCSPHSNIFKDLKAVFCRGFGNTGVHIRFGLRRLRCHMEAACSELGLDRLELHYNSEKTSSVAWDDNTEGWGCESKFWIKDDPTHCVANFVNALAKLTNGGSDTSKRVEKVILNAEVKRSQMDVSVVIKLKKALRLDCGGKECENVKRAFEGIPKNVLRIPSTWSSTKEYSLKFDVSDYDKL